MPKVLVATQTRVVEAVADVDGAWVPSTPVVAVPAPPERLWHVLAALLAPPVTAWALHETAGTALAPGAWKLSAAQVRQLPAPADARLGRRRRAAAQAAQARRAAAGGSRPWPPGDGDGGGPRAGRGEGERVLACGRRACPGRSRASRQRTGRSVASAP